MFSTSQNCPQQKVNCSKICDRIGTDCFLRWQLSFVEVRHRLLFRVMFKTLTKSFKQFLTAFVLLLVAVLVLEFVLQLRTDVRSVTVSGRTDSGLQPLLVPSAVTHHEMRRLLNVDSAEFKASIRTNSLGLRGVEPADTRPQGLFRILLLGDENILGPDLTAEETVSARLQNFLVSATGRPVEVINGGVPGYCPLLSWLQFRHELRKLNPDLIVLHFDMSDVADDAAYRCMLRDASDHQICTNPMLGPDKLAANPFVRLARNSCLCQMLAARSGSLSNASKGTNSSTLFQKFEWTAATQKDLRLQIQHALLPIQNFQRDAEKDAYKLIVSSVPVPWQVAAATEFPRLSTQIATNSAWPQTEDLPFQVLEAACASDNVPFCNTTTAFRNFSHTSKLFNDDSVGLSKYGGLLYAREIASMILNSPVDSGLASQPSSVESASSHVGGATLN